MKTTLEEFLKGRRWAVTREGVESRENILSDRALRCLSYLINSFLTDIKQLANTSKVGGGYSPPPSDVYVRSFVCPFSL